MSQRLDCSLAFTGSNTQIQSNMKIKEGFKLRNVCGESIIVAEGRENIDFSKIISLNESAAFLWTAVEGRDFSVQDMADLLANEYDVTPEAALADAKSLAEKWQEIGIVTA